MLMVGIQFVRPILKLRAWPLSLALVTTGVSVATNMAVGFLVGLAAAYAVRRFGRRDALGPDAPSVR